MTNQEKKTVRRLMFAALNDGDCIDSCGEVQCGELAESVAIEMDRAEWLDDECHEIWDIAVDVGLKWQDEQETKYLNRTLGRAYSY